MKQLILLLLFSLLLSCTGKQTSQHYREGNDTILSCQGLQLGQFMPDSIAHQYSGQKITLYDVRNQKELQFELNVATHNDTLDWIGLDAGRFANLQSLVSFISDKYGIFTYYTQSGAQRNTLFLYPNVKPLATEEENERLKRPYYQGYDRECVVEGIQDYENIISVSSMFDCNWLYEGSGSHGFHWVWNNCSIVVLESNNKCTISYILRGYKDHLQYIEKKYIEQKQRENALQLEHIQKSQDKKLNDF